MLVFIDFEASSLGKHGYPIEVAWVFETGASEAHLIRPAPGWDDWDREAEAIHRIDRATLVQQGTPHDVVAARMIDALSGHDLLASAPSWDGKWLSRLLRAAGQPRHRLRLRDSEQAQREVARAILARVLPDDQLEQMVDQLLALVQLRKQPAAHRALADAEDERRLWLAIRTAATEEAEQWRARTQFSSS